MTRQELFNELALKVTAERSIDAVVLDEVLQLRAENASLKAELSEAKKDAERFHWLTEDHPDRDTRTRCRGVLDRMAVLSYSGACLEIDASMKGK